MKASRGVFWGLVGALFLAVAVEGKAQIVINEVVKEQLTDGAGSVNPDTREFIELYNAGDQPVDIGGWTLNYWRLTGTDPNSYNPFVDVVTPGTMLQPDSYYVLGATGVPNLNQAIDFGTPTDLFEDGIANVIELRDNTIANGGVIKDAVAYDVGRTGINPPTYAAGQLAEVGKGFHGRLISTNVPSPNSIQSWGRWEDGLDTNVNGRDFGILPATPGATNNLPQVPAHTVPDVEGATVGDAVNDYYTSFKPARVIDPTVATSINPHSVPAPPGGRTKAILAWDETGGGNVTWSRELVNKFDIQTYFKTTPFGGGAGAANPTEQIGYGIGTADHFYGTPDPDGVIFPTSTTFVQNSSTGIGWLFQQRESTAGVPTYTKLFLVDYGAGGDSRPILDPPITGDTRTEAAWNVIEEIDLSSVASGWYRLGMEYDPDTGEVVAWFDDQTFTFNTITGLKGNFYAAYRSITANSTQYAATFTKHTPPMFVEFISEGLDGDYNNDGTVDAADYVTWAKNRTAHGGAGGYTTWVENFGESQAGSGDSGAVPEPGAIALVLIGLSSLTLNRRGR